MPNAPDDIITKIAEALKKSPGNITQISKRAGINRITVSQYLHAFEKAGFVTKRKSGRDTIYALKRNPSSYFNLPIAEEHQNLFDTYYYHIRQFCQEKYNKEPTKTQAYKILWELNRTLELDLPFGWYMHGPCAVQVYEGDEQAVLELDAKQLKQVKETTEKYGSLDPYQLSRKIYEQENNALYLAKDDMMKEKTNVNHVLMELVKAVPASALDVTTDFARAAMLVGWERSKVTWDKVWKYIALTVFADSERIKKHYVDNLGDLADKIQSCRKEAQLEIQDLVRTHIDSGKPTETKSQS